MPPVSGGSTISAPRSVFTATADDVQKGSVVLVTIDLESYGGNPALTLHLSTQEYVDPDGVRWDPILAHAPGIEHGGSFLETHWQPVDAMVVIYDLQINGLPATETFSYLLRLYRFTGSRIRIEQAFDNLTSTADFRTIFEGEIAQRDEVNYTAVAFHCVQSRRWNKAFPPRVVDRANYPDAPEEVIGTALPIVLGDWNAPRYIYDELGVPSSAYLAGVARGACPLLVTSSPSSTGGIVYPKFHISDREIDDVTALASEVFIYDATAEALAGAGLAVVSNPAGGPATLRLGGMNFLVAFVPIEIDAATTALNAQECTRKAKDSSLTGHADLNYDTSKRVLRLNLPDIQPIGDFLSASLAVYYSKNAWFGTIGQYGITNADAATSDYHNFMSGGTFGFPTTFYARMAFQAVPTNVISKWEDIKNCYLEANVKDFGQRLSVHRFVLWVTFRARARVERPGTKRQVAGNTTFNVKGQVSNNQSTPLYRTSREVTSQDLVSFDNAIYWYGKGTRDDGSGTYTGTPSALIEHPVDMARFILRDIGGVASGEIVESSGEFGSFADAKTALSGYKFRCLFSDRQDIASTIADLGQECLAWFKRTPTLPGNPWTCVPWDIGSAVNYRSVASPFVFYRARQHVSQGTFRVPGTRISRIRNAVRLNFDWDPRTNTYGEQLYITPSGSRVFTGIFGFSGFYTTDPTRVSQAADSEVYYGLQEQVLNSKFIRDPDTANSVLTRYFDLVIEPKVEVRFETYINAYDLNRGHVIEFASDWDSFIRYPGLGSDGSWAGKAFRVTNLKRLKGLPVRYGVICEEV